MQNKISQIEIMIIIERLKTYFQTDTDKSLASALGVRQNTISTWRLRNVIDFKLIIAKCDNINFNWLFFDEGPVFRSDIKTNSSTNAGDAINNLFLKQIISEKEEKIESLNREIGRLQNQIELLKKEK